jgi:hypothetical protein
MRNLVLCLALFACNDDNLMGGMSDMTVIHDLTPIIDMAMRLPDGVMCGGSVCNAPQVCCVKPSMGGTTAMCGASGSCGDGGAELMCDGPEDCPATMHNCCATAKFSLSGTDAAPMAQGANAACGSDAACPAGVDLAASELHTKLCHTAADCVGYSGTVPIIGAADFDGCCTSTQAPGIQFCAPSNLMTFMGRMLYTCQ